jgi:hypothetical protein
VSHYTECRNRAFAVLTPWQHLLTLPPLLVSLSQGGIPGLPAEVGMKDSQGQPEQGRLLPRWPENTHLHGQFGYTLQIPRPGLGSISPMFA